MRIRSGKAAGVPDFYIMFIVVSVLVVFALAVNAGSAEQGYTKPYGMTDSTMEPWQTSWQGFVEEVRRMYGSGAGEEEFAARFNGKEIVWAGQALRVVMDAEDPVIVTLVQHENVVLPDGRVAKMDNELSLHVTGPFKVTGGQDFRFRAKLGPGNAFFPSSVYDLRVKDPGTGLAISLVKVSLVDVKLEQ